MNMFINEVIQSGTILDRKIMLISNFKKSNGFNTRKWNILLLLNRKFQSAIRFDLSSPILLICFN